jgi:CRP-like cAMP-binding protein
MQTIMPDIGTEWNFLKEADIFNNLDLPTIRNIIERGQLLTLTAGAELFRIGQPTEHFYVIRSGIVEICRASPESPQHLHVVAYLGTSDSLGEMNLILSNNHGSLARLPQGGELFHLTREQFLRVLDEIPAFTKNLLLILAQRLESRLKNSQGTKKHLHGNLQFFDLPTVLQTIIGSKLTGTLVLTDEAQEPLAEVNFAHGEVRSAFLGNLFGEEAFMQLFQPAPHLGTFDFRTGPIQDVGDAQFEINRPTFNLLMESIRLQDELIELKKSIKDNDTYVPLGLDINWDPDDSYYPLALQLWLVMCEHKYTVAELRESTLRCHYYCYHVLDQLLKTRQIMNINPQS